jgi:hypothetical protein
MNVLLSQCHEFVSFLKLPLMVNLVGSNLVNESYKIVICLIISSVSKS